MQVTCPRVALGLLAVKAAVEPKKVVMAAIFDGARCDIYRAGVLAAKWCCRSVCPHHSHAKQPANQLSRSRSHFGTYHPMHWPDLPRASSSQNSEKAGRRREEHAI